MRAKPQFSVKSYYFTGKSSENYPPKSSHSGPLFKQNNILKFYDKNLIGNIIFATNLIIF